MEPSIAEVTRLLSMTALALFAGGMLTEACVLVPYWRSLKPEQFLAYYADNGRRLHGFFSPLTIIAALLALAAAVASWPAGGFVAMLTATAAVILLMVVGAFFVYFKQVNISFSQGSLPPGEVGPELARWAAWHWWRTALSFVALAAAIISVAATK